ncbi:polyhydroxybutyrate depolymerase [Angomonas deanei]|nr:polyhydroxybutyrate depolymerase [Angomonas deanei]|eukprot:EPY26129.1 polyhydroxybutyrate depolymerase [Angomonas deanei]
MTAPASLPSYNQTCTLDPTNVVYGALTEVSVEVTPGETRKFLLYVPNSYKSSMMKRREQSTGDAAPHYTPVALQLLFHGLNDNSDNFIKATEFMPYAEQYNYIIASASGTLGWLGYAWNSGTCCGFTSEEKPNEFLFIQRIIEIITNEMNLCVHQDKLFATGFSNGAMLAEVLGCHMPYTIRVATSVGGVVEVRPGNAEGLAKCTTLATEADKANGADGKRRTSVLMIRGDNDNMVAWGGNAILGFPSVEDDVKGWVSRNGCTSDVTTTINTSFYENYIYENCHVEEQARHSPLERGGESIVELVRVKGGSHTWPEANNFSTTDYIIDFTRRVFISFLDE